MAAKHASLVKDLKKLVRSLEPGLRSTGSADPGLRGEWVAAREAGRTAAGFDGWLDDRVTQVAVAWVLGTVFVRFCEDNGLIELPVLAGPGDRLALARDLEAEFFAAHRDLSYRDWICSGFDALSVSPVAAGLFESHNPMWSILPSPEAARELLGFWRSIGPDGSVVYDLSDPSWDTRFLGDLYQDLSEYAKKTYALLQTPVFVEDFILAHTLDPAIEEFGLEPAPPAGHEHLPRRLRVVDPACGSGHFLLGAFARLLDAWERHSPATDRRELISNALSSIHGVDKNPFAVAIARFRLMLAAMKACDVKRLSDRIDFPLYIAVGDSLLHGRGLSGEQGELGSEEAQMHTWSTEDVHDYTRGPVHMLEFGSYHAVVANPPYIAVKDKAESDAYRALYASCQRQYSLSVPFAERIFQLAIRGSQDGRPAGYTGQITANSFMKREFGKKLIEEFFPQIDLTRIIDTSGAYIPGHGAPTVILFGRSRFPRSQTVGVTASIHGEPHVPLDPAVGVVWQSVLKGMGSASYRDGWTRVLQIDRSRLASFPWSLSGTEADGILRQMETGSKLGGRVSRIGYFASTGADDVFVAPPEAFRRIVAEPEPLIPVITGSEVRNWSVHPQFDGAMFPPADESSVEQVFPVHFRRLWPYRTVLESRRNYSGHTYREDSRTWYGWHHVTDTPDAHPWSIVFSWVSTNNHFAVMKERAAPLNSAPVIRLPDTASDSDILQLTALLNSSLACFWLKQNSNSKGQPRADQTGTGEPWTLFYEFTGTRLADFPLPPDRWSGDRWSVRAADLDQASKNLTNLAPRQFIGECASPLRSTLDEVHDRWRRTYAQAISLQEELDWEIYRRYGLVTEAENVEASRDSLPGLQSGERAFEIVLARKAARGEITTTWFSRHGIEPITELPIRWSARYREIVENRIRLIEEHPAIGVVERPEFKRRWEHEPWQAQEAEAIRVWLLDRCEERSLWYGPDGQPRSMTVGQLAGRLSADVAGVAQLLTGPDSDLADVLKGIIADEHVPYLAKLRYKPEGMLKRLLWERTWDLQREEDRTGKRLDIAAPPKYSSHDFVRPSYWRNRGKLDVPKERFISYPGASPGSDNPLLLGWAGWDHREQAHALVTLIEERTTTDGWGADRITPLLAGLAEVMPWVRQWHHEIDENYDDYLASQLAHYRLTEDDLGVWHPAPPKRGRPRKQI